MSVCLVVSSGSLVVADPQPADMSTCSAVAITGQDYLHFVSMYNSASDVFDPVIAGSIFAFFFSLVCSFYVVSRPIGLILHAIRVG